MLHSDIQNEWLTLYFTCDFAVAIFCFPGQLRQRNQVNYTSILQHYPQSYNHESPDTPCALVQNMTRESYSIKSVQHFLFDLANLPTVWYFCFFISLIIHNNIGKIYSLYSIHAVMSFVISYFSGPTMPVQVHYVCLCQSVTNFRSENVTAKQK